MPPPPGLFWPGLIGRDQVLAVEHVYFGCCTLGPRRITTIDGREISWDRCTTVQTSESRRTSWSDRVSPSPPSYWGFSETRILQPQMAWKMGSFRRTGGCKPWTSTFPGRLVLQSPEMIGEVGKYTLVECGATPPTELSGDAIGSPQDRQPEKPIQDINHY